MTQSHSYIVNFISLSIGRGTDDLDFFFEGIGFAIIASVLGNIANITINTATVVLLIRHQFKVFSDRPKLALNF